MKILLIGGNGYIGCRLYKYLLHLGYSVDNVDICFFGRVFSETILCDFRSMSKEFLKKYSHIILLAGHSCPSMCQTGIYTCWKNNVDNFANLLDKLSGDIQLIYASTAAIYNDPYLMYAVEDDYLGGIPDIYTLTKRTIEELAKFRPNSVGLRFGTVGGWSENFRKENLINSIVIDSDKHSKIEISNPRSFRSILGMNDLCRSINQIIIQGIKKSIYNIVSDSAMIIDFAEEIKRITKCELVINQNMKTAYTFHCSSELFEKDYNFKFLDTVESIYFDIVDNLDKIIINEKRSIVHYE